MFYRLFDSKKELRKIIIIIVVIGIDLVNNNNNYIPYYYWIYEKLLETPIHEFRKMSLMEILCPYLVNIKKLSI